MDQTKKQQLQALKAEILNDVVPIIDDSNFDPAQKFELLLASARISESPDQFRAAYDMVKQIEASDIKADAMLDLIDAIEYATPEDEVVTNEAEQPQA